jgi:alpha-tubulin suppressor-like RCC1 family protein
LEVTAIAAGFEHTLALKGDGTLWAWGGNRFGQLGISSTTNRSAPVQVAGLSGVTAIAAGSSHTVALKGDGTPWAWGEDNFGQLGIGGTVK